MARLFQGLTAVGVSLALGLACLAQDQGPTGKITRVTQKQAKGKTKKSAMPKAVEPEPTPAGDTGADDGVRFSRDIAPVLTANCSRCHNTKDMAKNSKFDVSTFKSLMGSGEIGEAIVPGKADMSHLVLRLKGEDEGRRMPPGQNRVAPEAISKIEAWINAGAILDSGYDPTKPIASYAASPEQLKKDKLAKLSESERDTIVEEKAKERLKQASEKGDFETYPGKHFILFGKLPKARVDATQKLLETQFTRLKTLLTYNNKYVLDGPEKISIYIFNDRPTYVEFVRAVESREADKTVDGHGNLAVESPYLALIDPANGRDEAPAPKKAVRTKKGAAATDDTAGPNRTLAGLLTEQLAASATQATGKAPRWLSMGLGSYMGSLVDGRGPYYSRQRTTAFEQAKLGWRDKAQDALGGQLPDEKARAIGFAIVEFLATEGQQVFPDFVHGMLEGGDKLDEVVGATLGLNREQFLAGAGEFVANHYGQGR